MTAVETQGTQEEQMGAESNGKNVGSKYIIFRRLPSEFGDRDVWQELGEVKADGAYAARMKGVEQFNLMGDVRSGECEIVSLGARFWAPKRPKVNVSESLDVS
jgi:hypothetical protein